MRNVVLYMSMSLDGYVASERKHPGAAIAEGAELKEWKLGEIARAGAHLIGPQDLRGDVVVLAALG